jgi:hypothetical protein
MPRNILKLSCDLLVEESRIPAGREDDIFQTAAAFPFVPGLPFGDQPDQGFAVFRDYDVYACQRSFDQFRNLAFRLPDSDLHVFRLAPSELLWLQL